MRVCLFVTTKTTRESIEMRRSNKTYSSSLSTSLHRRNYTRFATQLTAEKLYIYTHISIVSDSPPALPLIVRTSLQWHLSASSSATKFWFVISLSLYLSLSLLSLIDSQQMDQPPTPRVTGLSPGLIAAAHLFYFIRFLFSSFPHINAVAIWLWCFHWEEGRETPVL